MITEQIDNDIYEICLSSDAELKDLLGIDEPMPRTALLGIMAAREAMKMAFDFRLSTFDCCDQQL